MICFVILHYQAKEETIGCVKKIEEMTSSDWKIIIVDNASPNGSGKELKAYYKENSNISVVLSEQNLGFAKGNNLGYQEAKKYRPDFIVVMNNDILLTQKDFIERVYASYKNNAFDVLGPDIFSTATNTHQNPQREQNVTEQDLKRKYRFLYWKCKLKFLIRIKYLFYHKSSEQIQQTTDYTRAQTGKPLHGSCYIFSEKFIQKHEQCFFPGTFMYFESYILHYLGMRENLIFYYEPNIEVIHHEDVSTNQTYQKKYERVVFVNQCLLESCKVFLDIMSDDTARIDWPVKDNER